MTHKTTPKMLLIASMTIFGTLGVFVRNIPLPSSELALYRAVMAAVLVGLFMIVTKQKIPYEKCKKEIPLLLLSGAAMGINWILLFQAYRYTTVSIATLSYYFAPVIVTVVCPILFQEKMTRKQILCFVMSSVGIICITGTGHMAGEKNFLGIMLGLSAALFYAGVIIMNKFIKNVQGLHRTLFQFVAAVIVLFPYVLITSGISLNRLDNRGWINLLIVGVIHTGVAYLMYFSALKWLPGQQVAILSYMDPLIAVVISVTFLGENMSPMQILGGLCILGFTLWNETGVTSFNQEIANDVHGTCNNPGNRVG